MLWWCESPLTWAIPKRFCSVFSLVLNILVWDYNGDTAHNCTEKRGIMTLWGSHKILPCKNSQQPQFWQEGWPAAMLHLLPFFPIPQHGRFHANVRAMCKLQSLCSLPQCKVWGPSWLNWSNSPATPSAQQADTCTLRALLQSRHYFFCQDGVVLPGSITQIQASKSKNLRRIRRIR